MSMHQRILDESASSLQMNSDYEIQAILLWICTCERVIDAREEERSYAFSEDFEEKTEF